MRTHPFTLRLPIDIHQQLQERSKIIGRSLNKEIEHLVIWALNRQIELDEALILKMQHRSALRDAAASTDAPLHAETAIN